MAYKNVRNSRNISTRVAKGSLTHTEGGNMFLHYFGNALFLNALPVHLLRQVYFLCFWALFFVFVFVHRFWGSLVAIFVDFCPFWVNFELIFVLFGDWFEICQICENITPSAAKIKFLTFWRVSADVVFHDFWEVSISCVFFTDFYWFSHNFSGLWVPKGVPLGAMLLFFLA